MPEGPEVARTLEFLISQLKRGSFPYLVNVLQFGDRFPDVNIEHLRPSLNQPLLDLFCKGKEYFFVFQSVSSAGEKGHIAVRGHHGMKGHWDFEHPSKENDGLRKLKNYHFRLDFSWDLNRFQQTQTPDAYLYYYNEQFGQFEILPSLQAIQNSLLRLAGGFIGRFILTKTDWMFSWGQLGKSRQLRAVLMDQEALCSGIGNYLLAEILYAARLHPEVLVGQLTDQEVSNLYDVCAYIITGHYKKTLEKVIYKKKVSPAGYPISYLTKGGRKIWYSSQEQIAR
jgi:formamidopyrimidine-DNA glycosylase